MSNARVIIVDTDHQQAFYHTPFCFQSIAYSAIKKRDVVVAIYPFGSTSALDLLYDTSTTSQQEAALQALHYAPFFDPQTTYLSTFSDELHENNLTSCIFFVSPLEHFKQWHHPFKNQLPFIDIVFPFEYLLSDFHQHYVLYLGEEKSFFYNGYDQQLHTLDISLHTITTSFQKLYSGVNNELIEDFLQHEKFPDEFSKGEHSIWEHYERMIEQLTHCLIPPSSTLTLFAPYHLLHLLTYFSDNTPWKITQNDPPPFKVDPWLLIAYEKAHSTPLETLCGNISPLGRPLPFYKRPSKFLWFSLVASLVVALLFPIYYLASALSLKINSSHLTQQISINEEELKTLQSEHLLSKEANEVLSNDTKILEESFKQQQKGVSLFLETHEKMNLPKKLEPLFSLTASSQGTLKKISLTPELITATFTANDPLSLSLLNEKLSHHYLSGSTFTMTKDEKNDHFTTTLTLKDHP